MQRVGAKTGAGCKRSMSAESSTTPVSDEWTPEASRTDINMDSEEAAGGTKDGLANGGSGGSSPKMSPSDENPLEDASQATSGDTQNASDGQLINTVQGSADLLGTETATAASTPTKKTTEEKLKEAAEKAKVVSEKAIVESKIMYKKMRKFSLKRFLLCGRDPPAFLRSRWFLELAVGSVLCVDALAAGSVVPALGFWAGGHIKMDDNQVGRRQTSNSA